MSSSPTSPSTPPSPAPSPPRSSSSKDSSRKPLQHHPLLHHPPANRYKSEDHANQKHPPLGSGAVGPPALSLTLRLTNPHAATAATAGGNGSNSSQETPTSASSSTRNAIFIRSGGGGHGHGHGLTTKAQTSSSSAADHDKPHPASFRPASLTVNTSPRNVSIIINPMEAGSSSNGTSSSSSSGPGLGLATSHAEMYPTDGDDAAGPTSPEGTESPGTSQMSPPPSYHDIPGTVPAHQGVSRGPPPSYDDAVNPDAEPPSYDSLFGRIRDTHKTSRNFFDFLVKLLVLFLGTLGCTIACSVTIIIPVLMIVVGAVHFNECPAEPYIPIFLVVGGCVWVYRVYKPLMDDSQQGDPNYCNATVYIFAFWLITTAYIFLGVVTSCICCISIVTTILKREY